MKKLFPLIAALTILASCQFDSVDPRESDSNVPWASHLYFYLEMPEFNGMPDTLYKVPPDTVSFQLCSKAETRIEGVEQDSIYADYETEIRYTGFTGLPELRLHINNARYPIANEISDEDFLEFFQETSLSYQTNGTNRPGVWFRFRYENDEGNTVDLNTMRAEQPEGSDFEIISSAVRQVDGVSRLYIRVKFNARFFDSQGNWVDIENGEMITYLRHREEC